MKFILIKAGGNAEVVELKEQETINYIKMKEYLEITSPVDCIRRKIGNNYYDLWVDDEGLFKEDRIVGGICIDKNYGQEVLVGNILILQVDSKGNSIGLTDAEIDEIMKKCILNTSRVFKKDKDLVLSYSQFGDLLVKPHSDFLIYTIE